MWEIALDMEFLCAMFTGVGVPLCSTERNLVERLCMEDFIGENPGCRRMLELDYVEDPMEYLEAISIYTLP